MKIADRKPKEKTTIYLLAKSMAIVAGVFTFLVCVLMISNHFRMAKIDPIHSPSLERMIHESEQNPHDEQLKEEIRELDLLARRAFFSSTSFNKIGVYLLLAGIALLFISLKTLATFNKKISIPEASGQMEDHSRISSRARWLVVTGGIILIGCSLTITFLSHFEITGVPLQEDQPDPVSTVNKPTRQDLEANWPALRGVDNLGVAFTDKAPTQWNGETGEGVIWKTAISKPGFSSPIIWQEKIFISGGTGKENAVFCYLSNDGTLLWETVIQGIPGSPEKAPKVTADTGYAAATMATDGNWVFSIYANGDLAALDMEGQQVWGRNFGLPKNPYGHSSSLIIYDGILIVQFDHEKAGNVYGVDVASGEIKWETKRDHGVSWASPSLVKAGEKTELILISNPWVVSYDPTDGKELWKIECLGGEVAVSAAYGDGLLYVMSEYFRLAAIDMGSHQIKWEVDVDLSGVSSPVITAHALVVGLSDGGMITRDPKTGDELWFEETDYGFYASPILVGDRVYFMDRSGVMHIFKDSKEFELIGRPELGEDVVATPVFLDGFIYIRGTKHLFKIGSDS